MWKYFEETGKAIDTDTYYGLGILPTWDSKHIVVLRPVFREDFSKAEIIGTFDDKESAKAYVKETVKKLNKVCEEINVTFKYLKKLIKEDCEKVMM